MLHKNVGRMIGQKKWLEKWWKNVISRDLDPWRIGFVIGAVGKNDPMQRDHDDVGRGTFSDLRSGLVPPLFSWVYRQCRFGSIPVRFHHGSVPTAFRFSFDNARSVPLRFGSSHFPVRFRPCRFGSIAVRFLLARFPIPGSVPRSS